jgi:dTDP-glucose 4,6-dehydratase
MRILVTGGAGFIGSNLVRHLVSEAGGGHEVLNVDALTYAGSLRSLADLAVHPRHRFERADVADVAAMGRLFGEFGPERVMHLAAESHVDRSIDGPAAFLHANIMGTFGLLQAARGYFEGLSGVARERFRFLHVSTDEVFGSLGAEGRFNEATAYDPRSPYAASKAASDHLVRAWGHTYGLPVLVTNCSNNYGPFQFPEKLVPVVILKALRGEPIPVYGQGENVRDWLYVGDHVEALAAVADGGRPGDTYAIGGDNELRNIDLVRRLCGLLDELRPRADGRPYAEQIAFVADRPGHDRRYAIDAAKIRAELGWRPRQDAVSGFRRTVRWYLDNEAWVAAVLGERGGLERLGTGARGAGADSGNVRL